MSATSGGFLAGKKTYIVMAVAIITAAAGYLTGDLDLSGAIAAVLAALGLGGVRDAINSSGS